MPYRPSKPPSSSWLPRLPANASTRPSVPTSSTACPPPRSRPASPTPPPPSAASVTSSAMIPPSAPASSRLHAPGPGPPRHATASPNWPCAFPTRLGGLFFFVPLMRDLRLPDVVAQAQLPGSLMIPAEQAVRTLLALKLVGTERKSHIMDLVDDQGIALFAGLNVVPKRSYLAAYSSQIDDRTTQRLLAA